MKKVLITGSKGFTGKELKELLKKKKYEVIEIDCDISNKKELAENLLHLDFDYVVHLAAITNVEFKNVSVINKINVDGTINLLSVINNYKLSPKLIIIPSSAYVYGSPKNCTLSESSELNPLNSYGKSKLIMENLSKDFGNLPILITRPFNYTGQGQDLSFLIPKIISHLKLKKKKIQLGNLNVKREFNDVRDICKIYIKFLENIRSSDTVNICSGKSYSIRCIIEICQRLTGHHIDIVINSDLKRKKEINEIVGDPRKMNSMIGNYKFISLEDSLKFMLFN